MSIDSWVLYLSILFFASVSPGPAALFIMESSIRYGNRKAIFGVFGNLVGLLLLGAISITSLGGILKTSEALFNIIKYAGALYLVYLGGSQFLKSKMKTGRMQLATQASSSIKDRLIFYKGLLIAITNPKAVVLMVTLFPQFIQKDEPIFAQFLQLVIVLMIFSFSFLATYASLAGKMRSFINNEERMQLFNKVSGSILIIFGFLMLRISK